MTDDKMASERRLLPREGFHADVLGRILRQTLLNPLLTVPALLALRFTDRGRELALRYPRALVAGAWLAGVGLVRVANGWLGNRAMNNGVADRYDWAREIVVVTGGADGIGKRVVQMLAARGIKTVVLDVQPLTFEPGPNVFYYRCDITDSEAILAAKLQIESNVGHATVLVNNAGVCRGKSVLEGSDADLHLTFGVNTLAHYKLARAFVPPMVQRNHGMVVTVASTAAFVTAPLMCDYAASKAAAHAFHEGLAAELGLQAPKVRTVLLNQGYTRTALFQGFGVREDAFFGPSLHVDTVAEALVAKILSGDSGQIIMPGYMKLILANFRSLPNWMQYNTRKKLGFLMKDWSGRQVVGNKEV